MTNKKKVFIILLGLVILLPTSALAAIDFAAGETPFAPENFNVIAIVNYIINGILNLIWAVFIGFAVVMFVWAGFLFVNAHGDPTEVATARKALLWGVIGVVVGVLAFTIPFFIQGTFSIR